MLKYVVHKHLVGCHGSFQLKPKWFSYLKKNIKHKPEILQTRSIKDQLEIVPEDYMQGHWNFITDETCRARVMNHEEEEEI